jgi:hypothetical protein
MVKNSVLSMVLALGSVLVGCASDPCDRRSPCPNDTPPSPSQVEQCRANLRAASNGPCYNEFIAYVTCGQNNVLCDSNGRTDPARTQTVIESNCRPQLSSYRVCCMNNPTALACQ